MPSIASATAQRRATSPRLRGFWGRRLGAGVPLGALSTVVAALFLAPVGAAGAQATADIRLAHLSPDTPAMDVYVVGFDGSEAKALTGLGYGQVSDYTPLDAGEYTFLLRPAGAPPDSDPAVTASATLDAGGAYTFAAMGPNADLRQVLLTDDLSAPPGGQAKVRLIQASSTAEEVRVRIDGGPLLTEGLPFAEATGYAPVAAGRWTVTATSSTGATVSRSLSLDPGTVNSLVVLEGTGGDPFDVTRLVDGTGVDATGATRGDAVGQALATPLGGVDTGGGGTAGALAVSGSDTGGGAGASGPSDGGGGGPGATGSSPGGDRGLDAAATSRGRDRGVDPLAAGAGVAVVAAVAVGGARRRAAHRPPPAPVLTAPAPRHGDPLGAPSHGAGAAGRRTA